MNHLLIQYKQLYMYWCVSRAFVWVRRYIAITRKTLISMGYLHRRSNTLRAHGQGTVMAPKQMVAFWLGSPGLSGPLDIVHPVQLLAMPLVIYWILILQDLNLYRVCLFTCCWVWVLSFFSFILGGLCSPSH